MAAHRQSQSHHDAYAHMIDLRNAKASCVTPGPWPDLPPIPTGFHAVASIDTLALNIADLRAMARRRLPRGVFEFIERGSEDDYAVHNNRASFDHYRLRPNVLKDVSKRTLATQILGRPSAMPLVMAPTGAAGLVWHDGEVALAKAAAAAGIPFTLSTASLTSIERIAAEAPGRLWFQLYMWPDRLMSHDLVKRVQKAGFETLVVTVDGTVSPNRESNVRNGFVLPFRPNRRNFFDIALHPRWLTTVILRYMLTTGMPRFENFPEVLQRSLTAAAKGRSALPKTDSLTWDDLRMLRKVWMGPLLVKGILSPEDALTAPTTAPTGSWCRTTADGIWIRRSRRCSRCRRSSTESAAASRSWWTGASCAVATPSRRSPSAPRLSWRDGHRCGAWPLLARPAPTARWPSCTRRHCVCSASSAAPR